MKAKHHFWSSLVAGGALYVATGSTSAFTGAMLGGFLIDADHVIDQWWSIKLGAPLLRKSVAEPANESGFQQFILRFFRRRKLLRLFLLFHSFELLLLLASGSVIYKTPFLIGLFCGYGLHLALDLWRHYHEFNSPFFYFLLYRATHGFKREKLIVPKYW
jgi:hypothetical protein